MDGGPATVTRSRVSPLAPWTWRNRLAYWLHKWTLRLLLGVLFRVRVGPVPPLPEGPVILAANHRSYLDPILLGAVVPLRVTYMMTAKYYDSRRLGWFFRMARCIVIEEKGGNRQALRDARDVLAMGRCVGVFPEGHISPDGELKRGQGGVAWLAAKTGATVVPVFISGTREAFRKGERRIRPFQRITVAFGEPISIAAFGADRAGQEAFSRELMARIAALGGVAPPE